MLFRGISRIARINMEYGWNLAHSFGRTTDLFWFTCVTMYCVAKM